MTIIFDLDGTLLNSIDDLGHACNYALEHCGYATHPIEAYPRMVGNGINNLIRRALPENDRSEETIMRLRAFFVPYYNTHNCDYTRPYEGIPAVLEVLKKQGVRLGVASNKYQEATEKIVSHFFPGVFDVRQSRSKTQAGYCISVTVWWTGTPPVTPAYLLSPVHGDLCRVNNW